MMTGGPKSAPKNDFTSLTALMVAIGAITIIVGDFVHLPYLAPIGMGIGAIGLGIVLSTTLRKKKR